MTAAAETGRIQRRTIATLVTAQAVGGLDITIVVATASLLATAISDSERQSGLVQTSLVLGSAVGAYLLARVMARRGRRIGLALGYLLGALGAVLSVGAGIVGSMPLLLVGAAMIGGTAAANNSARYAATDLASPETRARALSVVVWASTVGAVVGPSLLGPSSDLALALGIPELTGPFVVAAIGMGIAALVVWSSMRPDPLFLARQLAGKPEQAEVTGTSWGRVWAALRERPTLRAAMLGLSGAHAAMIAVMVMTPLHMGHGGSELRIIGLVISLHVLGMFAFSPLIGYLADKVGRAPVLLSGGVVLVLALLVCQAAPEGSSAQVFIGLFLLGLGWSLATVSASTLVADHAPLDARTDVQGAADLIMGLVGASAGGIAGLVMASFGYAALSLASLVLALVVVWSAIAVWRNRVGLAPSHSSEPRSVTEPDPLAG
ncbi:MAG: MFS transporter [Mycobacterium sp.]